MSGCCQQERQGSLARSRRMAAGVLQQLPSRRAERGLGSSSILGKLLRLPTRGRPSRLHAEPACLAIEGLTGSQPVAFLLTWNSVADTCMVSSMRKLAQSAPGCRVALAALVTPFLPVPRCHATAKQG